MAFDTGAVLSRIVTLLTNAGVQQVYTGAPESLSKRVSAYVAVVGQQVSDKPAGVLRREARYFVGLGYRVSGAEATAETDLATFLDAFLTAFYADRETRLNGTCTNCWLDLSLADDPQYQVTAGQEFRLYPFIVIAVQQQNV